ncbi:Gfo/Idh/MocA family oxidoreductase [Gilvimarinus sp. SDUM040013]|uniref:Gfo/Idh/MocA family oxidoreductase n=1 Tax=Gilvimarinus gilvus TaxID=3058038 RepID=A0ABU4RXS0_9GAMM|nr:Gfo/Idh/MocA family oxidoreductase [Gilvimarinus sp. SDUM040013]MDO3387283.1 Gfo/Idh/MocA family oxidoreductase [Gilvimarinus sp. SDUM040013]MDX6848972.1 Gfo/Idh/MocA family oxidoreductase [Gilvimarinus sp. SDUM040013]
MHKVRWGVLSTAKIARNHVIPAIQTSHYGEINAIASRHPAQAKQTAQELGIARGHESYEQLLADPNIDAIYNPLPNHLHVPWTLKALAAGKHVLVEKPVGLDQAQAQQLLNASRQYPKLKVMEAFMYRFHPQWQKVKDLLGSIGPVRNIQCEFSYNNREADNIRNQAAMGGGALMDIGCYGISLARFLFAAEPKRVLGHQQFMGFEVDTITNALMEFEQGSASFSCSTKTEGGQWVLVSGENGSVRLAIPFNPVADTPTQVVVRQNGSEHIIDIAPANHYRNMADQFCQAIINDSDVPTPLSDALANMQALDAIVASAQDGVWKSL